MRFLISTGYRTTGRSVIWRLDLRKLKLEVFREDQYYGPDQVDAHDPASSRPPDKDYIYFGMAISGARVYSVGGNVLSVLDGDGNLVERREVSLLRDAHDLQIIDNTIYCTNTGHDTVEMWTMDLQHTRTIRLTDLPCFRDRKLLQKSEGSPDSLHVNFVSSRDGKVMVTYSFVCEQDRPRAMLLAAADRLGRLPGCKPAENKAVVLDFRSGKILSSGGVITLTGDRVIHDRLNGAHDGVFFKDEFYVNSTHNIETVIFDRRFQQVQKIQYTTGVLLRGLHPIDQTSLLVGATRIDPNRTAASIYHRVLKARGGVRYEEASSVKVVDRQTGRILESIPFDAYRGVHPEVYKIIPVES